jgi:isopenicillin N synthase-like dioxygenase
MSRNPEGQIPVIDIGGLFSHDREAAARTIARAIAAAARDTGFFYIANHGVPAELIAGIFEANRSFHAQPLEAKLPLKLNAWHRGYQPMGSTRLTSSARFAPASSANQLESFIVRDEIPENDPDFRAKPFVGPNQWPNDPVFRAAVEAYYAALRALAGALLPVFAIAVGEDRDFFSGSFDPAATTLRLVHYPPTPKGRPPDHIGIHPHTDYGFFTILAQDDVGGLAIRRVDDSWVEAPFIEGAFVVNIGDALARWTNEAFNSSPHRVINKSTTRDRYSVALFFDPNHDAAIRCIDGFTGDPGGVKHQPIRFGDYYRERMDTNHPDRVAAGT